MGLEDKFKQLAQMCSTNVIIPADVKMLWFCREIEDLISLN